MGFKWEGNGLHFLDGRDALRPPWGYGVAYRPANRLSVVYYPIPLNYVIRAYAWTRWQIAWQLTRLGIWLIRLFTPDAKIG